MHLSRRVAHGVGATTSLELLSSPHPRNIAVRRVEGGNLAFIVSLALHLLTFFYPV